MPLTPQDLELPKQFTSWRPNQLETASQIASSSKYLFMLDSPTGTGKSLIGAAVQRILDSNVVYICTTKQLQDQLLRDFPYAKTLKGRGNYRCAKAPNSFPLISAETCTNSPKKPCEYNHECAYMIAKKEALEAPLAVLNTSYFLTEANNVGLFSGVPFLIIDEFDTIEDMLMSHVSVVITEKQIKYFNLPEPKYKTVFQSWVDWSRAVIKIIAPEIQTMEEELKSEWGLLDPNDIKRYLALRRIYTKLLFFNKEVDHTWIWYRSSDRWEFKPTWISKYANYALWRHAKRVLGMSATILDGIQVARNIGIKSDQYQYKCLGSPFPKENRPVYYEPCANVVNKQIEFALPALATKVASLLDKHKNDKVLIHTVSYKIASYLLKNVKTDRFITHTSTDRAEVLDKYKKSSRPLVLVSPSMDRGVDLPYDQCRVVIIAKVPYPDLGDKQISQRIYRSKDGNPWYAHKTVSKIIQMSGRATRSSSDYSTTYILDEQFKKIYTENRRFFPEWWRESLIL